MTQDRTCPGCGTSGASVFHELRNVPVHSVLLMPTREAALTYPKGDIALAFCRACGFIYNAAFDPQVHEYSSQYEETQGFSPTFNAFARRLADTLIEKYHLRNRKIVEIGCGKGEFLALLCELGPNEGVGFDPAYVSDRDRSSATGRTRFIKDFYSEKYAGYTGDFLCCRMTLEHIRNTAEFVSVVRRSLAGHAGTVVFFQVPDAVRILRETAFWDIYYEHCSYFSGGSLARLFRRCGFEVTDLWKDYDGQYLMIEARPAEEVREHPLPPEETVESLAGDVSIFAERCRRAFDSWTRYLNACEKDGRKVVIWGGGSKGVAFLTTLGISSGIEYVVDINPYKTGTFMAGTGQEIVSPEFLRAYRPDVVLVMNAVYQGEISQSLGSMGLTPEIRAL